MNRYVAKFVNGQWVVKDTHAMKHVPTDYPLNTESEAIALAEEMNGRQPHDGRAARDEPRQTVR